MVNDHATAHEIFAQWSEKAQGQEFAKTFRRLAEIEEAQTDESQQEFLAWWTAQRSEQLQQRFERALGEECGACDVGDASVAHDAGTQPNAQPINA